MTLHIDYNHTCGNCEAYYIPYDQDVPCPNCNTVEEERFDFITKAAGSMLYNKHTNGTYTPGAWWVGSLADHILRILFMLFDNYESDKDANTTIENYASEWLSGCTWGEQGYLEKHVLGMAVRVAEELYKDDHAR